LRRMSSGDLDTANGELTTLRIGRRLWVWTLAVPPVVVVAVVIARGGRTRSGRDGLFELLNLMGKECSTEGARHCELVRGRALGEIGLKAAMLKGERSTHSSLSHVEWMWSGVKLV
jgi:hypothetical protein